MLAPTSLQALAAIGPAIAYSKLSFGQGEEVLSMVAESAFKNPTRFSVTSFWFWCANGIAGLAIWWSARVILQFSFADHSPNDELPDGFRKWILLWWPRVLGIVPVAIIVWRLWQRASVYGKYKGDVNVDAYVKMLDALAWRHILLVALLLIFFVCRRLWLEKIRKVSEPSQRFSSVADMRQKSPTTFWIHYILLAVAFTVLAVVWIFPVGPAQMLGTGAMLSFAAAAWVTIGVHVMHLRALTGAPVVKVLIAAVLVFSLWNDNHFIRFAKEPRPAQSFKDRRTVALAFADWRKTLPQAHPGVPAQTPPVRPVFIVATAGGGIRAAYWAALVLGTLQDKSVAAAAGAQHPPDFASHLFAISGVSGGSIGAAVFDALLADGRKNGVAALSSKILEADHLAPLMGGLLFPEAVQKFWPVPLCGTDRARSFELSLETTCRKEGQTDRMADPFLQLWQPGSGSAPGHIPHLLLNSTLVESGDRLIFSDLRIDSDDNPLTAPHEFPGAHDAARFLFPLNFAKKNPNTPVPLYDVPLSTAAHASARFTYTNPQGTLGTGEHFVDGGYFDVSGAATALQVLEAVHRTLDAKSQAQETIVPVIILISNGPLNLQATAPAKDPFRAAPLSDSASSFAIDFLAPPATALQRLLHTYISRSESACAGIRNFQEQHRPAALPEGHALPRVIEFSLVDNHIPLPLGWALSKAANDDMNGQMWEQSRGAESNGKAIQNVLDWLDPAKQK